ncbi:MAG: M14 family zinc carboxypeptidase [Bacteroidetes bacterium]|nr:M14 family zinc carboxypeptidase [Bacteroidota bacterium]
MLRHLSACLLLLLAPVTVQAQDLLLPEAFQFAPEIPRDPAIPSPEAFLGRATGESYTLHADVVRYLHAVADVSDRVAIQEYGRTYENRPLYLLTVTSPANHARIADIQAANQRLADPATPAAEAAELTAANPIITWLSYNVHGNEPSSTESALEVLYLLAGRTYQPLLVRPEPGLDVVGASRVPGAHPALQGMDAAGPHGLSRAGVRQQLLHDAGQSPAQSRAA